MEDVDKIKIVESFNAEVPKDKTVSVLKTHLPYYNGLESLFPKESISMVEMDNEYLFDKDNLTDEDGLNDEENLI